MAATLCMLISACASLSANNCDKGLQIAVRESIYFGTGKKEGSVSTDEWASYINTTVTPRFPDGFTVTSASGQWQGFDGVIIKEPSYILTLVHSGAENKESAVNEIISIYKNTFQQESVLRVRDMACVSF